VTAEPTGPARRPSSPPSGVRPRLGPAEAAIFETFVVPRYLSLYGELALELLVESEQARVVHLFCRTGYPDRGISLKLPGSHIVGIDPSVSALQLARAKAATMHDMVADYRVLQDLPTPLPDSAFSHALTMHPLASAEELDRIIVELGRLLAPHGQLLVAMPLRGSFVELADLLREYALKFDDFEVAKAVDHAAAARPTPEGVAAQVERAGFEYVDVVERPTVLRFRNGRDFFEDPVARFLLVPEIKLHHRLDEGDGVLHYIREAIDKYWSESPFELTVQVGCVTGRRQ